MKFNLFIEQHQQLFEQHLVKTMNEMISPSILKDSMSYSLLGGGKRIRPMILLAMLQAGNMAIDKGMASAIAVEMIHCYSLIHDDLPAMDNDDYRRGKLTNHKVYSEAQAILSGDALLTQAFHVISQDSYNTDSLKLKIIALLAHCSGSEGMVAGQVIDIDNQVKTLKELENMHHLKTGKLLLFPFEASAYIMNWPENDIMYLKKYCYHLGIAFQVQDDILEITSDFTALGKSTQSDIDNNKMTYPALLGLEGAINKLKEHYIQAEKNIIMLPKQYQALLLSILDLVTTRKK